MTASRSERTTESHRNSLSDSSLPARSNGAKPQSALAASEALIAFCYSAHETMLNLLKGADRDNPLIAQLSLEGNALHPSLKCVPLHQRIALLDGGSNALRMAIPGYSAYFIDFVGVAKSLDRALYGEENDLRHLKDPSQAAHSLAQQLTLALVTATEPRQRQTSFVLLNLLSQALDRHMSDLSSSIARSTERVLALPGQSEIPFNRL